MVAMNAGRLLIDPPADGPTNMARDEALLAACIDPDAAPVVRFYGWTPPTISLGYFQAYSEFEQLPAPAGDLAVVRRTTGGGAILHDREITYSIVIPTAHPLVRGRPNRLYEVAHEAIIRTITHGARLFGGEGPSCGESSRRGPFFCFERRHALDVVVKDASGRGWAKIAGSAQRRTATAILQHGSIILDCRYEQQPCASWIELDPELTQPAALQSLQDSMQQSLAVELRETAWPTDALQRADAIRAQYCGDDWTRRRQKIGQDGQAMRRSHTDTGVAPPSRR